MKRNGYVRYTALGLIMLFSFVLTSIPGSLPDFFGSYPVILIPMVACIGLFEKDVAGGFFGLFAGMLLDAFSTYGGIYSTLMLCACGFAAGILGKHVLTENILSGITLSCGIAFLYLIGFWVLFYVFKKAEGVFAALLYNILPCFVYTAVFVLLFYPVVRAISLKARKER